MAMDTTRPRTRRAFLGAGIAALTATVANALGRPLSTKADDLDPLLLGQENTATNPTRITTTGNTALSVISDTDTALEAGSNGGDGIVGFAGPGGRFGVFGLADGSPGVMGVSGEVGLLLVSGDTGVSGVANQSARSIGVSGLSAKGRGVVAEGAKAQVRLVPSAAATHPASGQQGDLFVDRRGRLWFCQGGRTWRQLA